VVREAKGGFLGIGGEAATVRVTSLEESLTPDGPRDEGSGNDAKGDADSADSDDRPRRRRRGRRGGRGRGGGQGDSVSGENGGAEGRSRDDGPGAERSNDDEPRDDDAGDGNDDEPPRRDDLEQRERGGRGDRGGRGRGGEGRDRDGGRDRNGRGRGGGSRDRDRDDRPIEAVSDDELVLVPGAPPNLPEAINQEPEDDVDLFGSTLRDLLLHLGLGETSITARDPETPGDGVGLISQVFDIYGDTGEASDELAVLIGRRGETLNSLQYLLNVLASRQGSSKQVFGVDIEGYRRRREETLVDMAREIAAEVRSTGDVITLEPMPAAERRIIHLALQEEDGVQTESVGRGEDRQVEVLPD